MISPHTATSFLSIQIMVMLVAMVFSMYITRRNEINQNVTNNRNSSSSVTPQPVLVSLVSVSVYALCVFTLETINHTSLLHLFTEFQNKINDYPHVPCLLLLHPDVPFDSSMI